MLVGSGSGRTRASGMRYVRITLLVLLAGEILLLTGAAGWRLGASRIEYAPAVPPGAHRDGPESSTRPESPRRERRPYGAQDEAGPWFVNRARDLALDVVTTCGSPDKPSILHSL